MKNDYKDFLQGDQRTTKQMDQKVLNFIQSELNPEHKTVFLKLATIQGFIGFITMLFCPQFDFSLTNNYELFHFFHHTFGAEACMVFCGSIFLGSGAIFASYLLKEGEIKKIKSSRFLYYMSLSIIAVSIFMIFGAKIYLNLLLFWLVGSIGGGMIFFELNRLIREQVHRHTV